MYAFHNSHDLMYRSPFGAVEIQTPITIGLDLYDAPAETSCYLRIWQEKTGETLLPMTRSETSGHPFYSVTWRAPEHGALVWYYFQIKLPDGTFCYYGNNARNLGGIGQLTSNPPSSYQITVHLPTVTPSWYKDAIVYQIFVDRFHRDEKWLERQKKAERPADWKGPRRLLVQDWNDRPFYTRNVKNEVTRWPFWGGSLNGIREKIPYLQSLHVSAIYLNPIFRATSNHKYDTADYMEIDPSFGTEADFRALAAECKAAGIRLILDGVFNHTGADSKYFNQQGNYPTPGACQGPSSPYYSWYRFNRFPDQYECWWGVGDMPNVDETNPAYQKFIYAGKNSVVRRWLRAGASGWRLDVADELPDNFIAGIRKAVKETKPDAVLMGEVWEDASNKRSYGVTRSYFLGEEFDSTMHYPFRTAALDFMLGRITSTDFAQQMMSIKENYPPENFYGALNLIGSHDRARALTTLGGAPDGLSDAQKADFSLSPEQLALGVRRMKALTVLQFTAPGVPCIYYGDEAGAEGCEDPYNRGPYPWGNENQELLAHYRALTAFRASSETLKRGDFQPLTFGDSIYGCIRTWKGEQIVSLVNRSVTDTQSLDYTIDSPKTRVEALLDTRPPRRSGKRLMIALEPLEAVVFRLH